MWHLALDHTISNEFRQFCTGEMSKALGRAHYGIWWDLLSIGHITTEGMPFWRKGDPNYPSPTRKILKTSHSHLAKTALVSNPGISSYAYHNVSSMLITWLNAPQKNIMQFHRFLIRTFRSLMNRKSENFRGRHFDALGKDPVSSSTIWIHHCTNQLTLIKI